MMPIDPFFTSAVQAEDPRKNKVLTKQRIVWYHRRRLERYGKKTASKIAVAIVGILPSGKQNLTNFESMAAGSVPFVTLHSQQHPAINGFKTPRKRWRHRNSQHPE